MTNDTINDIADLRLLAWTDTEARVSIPNTEYHLTLDHAPGMDAPADIGRRISGRIIGKALKMANPAAGGNYIEPLDGHPRIVQGTVVATAEATRQLLVDIVVPVWVEMAAGQSATNFTTGDVVTFYLERGTRFEPA